MASSSRRYSLGPPRTVQELVREAGDFEFGSYRSLQNWLRSAQLLVTEAAICEQDGDLQRAYIYLIRHADLVIGKLPQHPEYRDPKYQDAIKRAIRAVEKNFAKLEKWKPKINQQYERYVAAVERRDAGRKRVESERLNDQRERLSDDWRRQYEDGVHVDRAQYLDANEHKELAVDLAHRELRRRDATKRSTRQAGIPPAEVADRRRGFVVNEEHESALEGAGDGVREAGRYLYEPNSRRSQARESSRTTSTAYNYPLVPQKEARMSWNMPQMLPSKQSEPSYGPPPALPAKEALIDSSSVPAVPPRPSPQTSISPTSPPPSPKYTFRSTATTEAGVPLRPLLLPPDLRTTFLNLAHDNTARNLETCGILCGTLISSALMITHLLIPDQISTSDTCDTTESGDNALFNYCDAHSLLVCGWIHTHPTQTCFLSSRDLHTSSGYQVMLPEAIAIVCAPRHNPDWGVFRLTDPPGLGSVLKCEKRGLFHPHEERNLYTDAGSPGHVIEGKGLRFEVVDLRGKE